jgi:uncharacterized protein
MKYLLMILAFYFLWFTKDLKQNNSEKIFLSDASLKKYLEYQKLAPNLDFLIVKVQEKDLSKISLIESLQEKFEEIELIKPPKMVNKNYQELSFHFIGPEHFAFMALVSPDYPYIASFVTEVENIFGKEKVSFLGNPYTNYNLDLYSSSIKDFLFPLCFALSFILIAFFVKNIAISFNIFFPALFSALLSLATVKAFYHELNLISSILPLMNFVICLSLMFHLYYTQEKTKDLRTTINEKILPVLLMLMTTAIGFGSLYFSKIKAISDFGLLSLFLIVMTGAIGLYWFRFCSVKPESRMNIENRTIFTGLFFKNTLNTKALWTFNIFALIAGAYCFHQMEVLTDATKYFPTESKFREKSEDIAKTVAGIPLYDLLLRNKPTKEVLLKMEAKVKAMNPEFRLLHLDRILGEANLVYSGTDTLPENPNAIAVLKSQVGMPLVRFFDESKGYRLLITGLPIDVKPYQEYLEKIKSIAIFDHIDGLYFHLMTGQQDMMETLYYSFLSSVLIIGLLAALYLKSFPVLFIFNLVNILPAFAALIILHLMGFSLNIATIMTFSIALGLVVDGTFHLIHSLKNKKLSFVEFHYTTTLPMILSTLIFCLSFSLFALHPFLPIRQFGVSLAIVCAFGLFFDLFILPTLYLESSKLKEHFRE